MNSKPLNIISARSTGDYRLLLTFDDGKEQSVDFKPFLTHAHHPDIRAFLDPAKFADFRVEYGDLIWGDYELCFPIIDLYRNELEHGSNREIAA